MKLTVMENSFNRYGGSLTFKPLEALFYLEDRDFGAALSEITLTLRFMCALPFEAQKVNKSLQTSYDKFFDLAAKPKRVFRRAKTELEIFTRTDFVSCEDYIPRSQDDYKVRRETYYRD